MAIRVQCANCGRVYNLPDDNAGKRLRCKQCAVVFAVPTPPPQAAPTAQKICVVCGQNVAGMPRTKDTAGNYFCRPCYTEHARSAAAMAGAPAEARTVEAHAGMGGGGGDNGEMIDLSALEPMDPMDPMALDDGALPPPPPIPDMDEPVFQAEEAPRPKKKKKKKKVVEVESGDSFASKMAAMPIELWFVAAGVIFIALGLMSYSLSGFMTGGLVLMGIGCLLWGHICIIMAAFAEGTGTGLMYMFLPYYPLIFIIMHWSEVQRFVGRMVLGLVLMFGGALVMSKYSGPSKSTTAGGGGGGGSSSSGGGGSRRAIARGSDDKSGLRNLSSDPTYNVTVDLDEPADDTGKMEKKIATTIVTTLKQRNVRPPAGTKYKVEAVGGFEVGDEILSVPLGGREMKIPAPTLSCKLIIKDGDGNSMFEKTRKTVCTQKMIEAAIAKKGGNYEEEIDQQMWNSVVNDFQIMAAEAPATPGATPP